LIIEPGWLETIQFIIRIVLAVLCTNMLGLAFRRDTFASPMYLLMLIGMGSALLKMISDQAYLELPTILDIAILMILILGVSILSAGILLKAKNEQVGYKTAGATWIAGAVGISVGSGYYLLAIVVSVLSYLVLNKIQISSENHFNF